MDAPNMPPPSMVDDSGHGNRQPDPEPELVTVNAKSAVPRKRKAREDGQPAQPRRLTRSHEACARCRRKKSKVTWLIKLHCPPSLLMSMYAISSLV
jgi:hypothetical protein